ncbi:MAG: MarC family protein [Rhizobiaceae bacterium]
MTQDALLNAFVTFFVTIDPPGLVGIFLALTNGMTSAQRRQTALRGTLIGFIIILGFMLIGGVILETLGISMSAFRIAGGLLLFYISFEMVFEKRVERKGEAAEKIISQSELHSMAVFPLAIPLIAGPGAISASILLASDFSWPVDRFALIGVLCAIGLIVYVSLLLADRMNRFISDTVQIIMTRLLGIILAALSVQFVIDGIMPLLR